MPKTRRLRGLLLAALMFAGVAGGCGAGLDDTIIRSGTGEIVPEHDTGSE